ncbi:hypothetical protein FIBSPDRAFT_879197 [Athelia psychrophila]|uniref:Uncharacterized protein n=1 Tax=Athelia psychrophila TaxID=1759441 RepID=A0A167U9L6_9AGAM|nr:hypothetical protein FIBSPDRAFT_879197 [Fibularhizoctonia sp. CBS 109695]
MPLGAFEVEKSSASGPGSGFKADQLQEAKAQGCSGLGAGGRMKSSMSTQDPRERPRYTDPQPCIAIRLAFTPLCAYPSFCAPVARAWGLSPPILPLNQETYDIEAEALPRARFSMRKDDVEATEATCSSGSCAIISQAPRTYGGASSATLQERHQTHPGREYFPHRIIIPLCSSSLNVRLPLLEHATRSIVLPQPAQNDNELRRQRVCQSGRMERIWGFTGGMYAFTRGFLFLAASLPV